MSGQLDGRLAVVTGSSSGIGEAVARLLVAAGSEVVVNSSSSVEAGEAVAASLGEAATYVQADLTDPEGRSSLLAAAEQRGQLDILVNNAGWTSVVPHGDLDGLTDAVIRKTFEVNVFGTLALTMEAMPLLQRSPIGNVVTVTSVAGVRPAGSSIAYAMSKAALNHMTALLAKSHGPVRFNAVAPGLVDTPWTETWTQQHATVAEIAPVGRASTPDEQAHAVMSFVTNSYATGSVLVVDGGLSLVS